MTEPLTTTTGRRSHQRLTASLALLLAVCALSACSTQHAALDTSGMAAPYVAGDRQWWRARIRMGYRDLAQVEWHVDALLADRVFAPVVSRLGTALSPWRFHRRASNDASGHQLSFIFYADRTVAERVANALESSALIDALQRSNHVEQVLLPGEDKRFGSDLGATSDRSWSPELKRSWPWFIMGVSQHWLALVGEVRAGHDVPASGEVDALLASYRSIHDEVDALWRQHAQHAYLHHLNAVFGYRALLLEERRLIRF